MLPVREPDEAIALDVVLIEHDARVRQQLGEERKVVGHAKAIDPDHVVGAARKLAAQRAAHGGRVPLPRDVRDAAQRAEHDDAGHVPPMAEEVDGMEHRIEDGDLRYLALESSTAVTAEFPPCQT